MGCGAVTRLSVCLSCPPQDSKQTTEEERERVYDQLLSTKGVLYAVSVVDNRRIDEINILVGQAGRPAGRQDEAPVLMAGTCSLFLTLPWPASDASGDEGVAGPVPVEAPQEGPQDLCPGKLVRRCRPNGSDHAPG